jgi:hypothetical protein
VPVLVGPGSAKVIKTYGCGGNTQPRGLLHDVIEVSKKLQVTGVAPAGAGPITPISAARVAALKVTAASLFIGLLILTIYFLYFQYMRNLWAAPRAAIELCSLFTCQPLKRRIFCQRG